MTSTENEAMDPRRAVFFFCADPSRDPVASRVFDASVRLHDLRETGDAVDGHPVLAGRDAAGNELVYVRTADVLSHDYPRYLPLLNERFGDADLALVVNWHEGGNAPDGILMAHTTGDVASGTYGAAHPSLTTGVLRALEAARADAGLDGYRTVTEATHWSGVQHGHSPELLARYAVPVLDVEIGSSPASWADPAAVEVLARALPRVFAQAPAPCTSLLCVGGVHFEPSFRDAVLGDARPHAVAVSHILANQWLGRYEGDAGVQALAACAASVAGGVGAVAFHDNLKGPVKAAVRALGEQLGVPVFVHRRLRQPEPLPAGTGPVA